MFYHETLSDPVLKLAERAEEQSAAMLALQKELDNESPHAQEREARWAQQDEEELQILRECCERLEEERASTVGFNLSCTISPYRRLTRTLLNSCAPTWRA